MRTFFLFCLLLAVRSVSAQNAVLEPWDAGRITDSLFDIRSGADTTVEVSYQYLRDSVFSAIVTAYVADEVSRKKYCWPFSAYTTVEDTTVYRLTDTWAHLLKTEYSISPHGIASGCVYQEWWAAYDSLMKTAILKRFGSDFFVRTKREADSLDRAGYGLQLPRIGGTTEKTIASLRNYFARLDTSAAATKWSTDEGAGFLMMIFKGDRPEEVYAAKRVFYVQQDFELMNLAPALAKRAQSLQWTGPRFRGKPADAGIVTFDLRNSDVYFGQWRRY